MLEIKPISCCDRFCHWLETLWFKWRVTAWQKQIATSLPRIKPTDLQARENLIQKIYNDLFLGDFLCMRKKKDQVRKFVELHCPLAIPVPEEKPVHPPKTANRAKSTLNSLVSFAAQTAKRVYSYFRPQAPVAVIPPLPQAEDSPKEQIRKALRELCIGEEAEEFADIMTDHIIPSNVTHFKTQDTYHEHSSGRKKLLKKDFEICFDRPQTTYLDSEGAKYLSSFAPSGVQWIAKQALQLPQIQTEAKIVGSIDYVNRKITYKPGCVTGELPRQFPDAVLRYLNAPKKGILQSLQFFPMSDVMQATLVDANDPNNQIVQEWTLHEFKSTFGKLTWP
jgi:hypothetical protein